ncbi:MAG: hypothetical protein R2831_05780 [Chitinophagaceae bacterium]
MFYEAYIAEAEKIFQQYQLQEPLHLFLKKYFAQHKKFGSRDRRLISDLLYGIYRLGKQKDIPIRNAIGSAALLMQQTPVRFFETCFPALLPQFGLSFSENRAWLHKQYGIVLNAPTSLSKELSIDAWTQNRFSIPRVFLRLRQKKEVLETLKKHDILFTEHDEEIISVLRTTALETVLNPAHYVIQDIASQKIGNKIHIESGANCWDACCASGGKAIQLLDKNIAIQLLCSDIRKNILQNLKKRMHTYGYDNQYTAQQIDASQALAPQLYGAFDTVLCDVPCSGSGTWARTPEQYYFFSEEKLKQYVGTQKAILEQTLHALKPNATLYYLTCSAFAAENEEAFAFDETYTIDCFEQGGDAMWMGIIKR